VSGLALVINFDLPNVPETYVHRIGRTGRANAQGIAMSFCSLEEKPFLKDIQRLIGQEILLIEDHPFANEIEEIHEKSTGTESQKNIKKLQPASKTKKKCG
jgi:ATP-dependent RNA helicase RhlE